MSYLKLPLDGFGQLGVDSERHRDHFGGYTGHPAGKEQVARQPKSQ